MQNYSHGVRLLLGWQASGWAQCCPERHILALWIKMMCSSSTALSTCMCVIMTSLLIQGSAAAAAAGG